MAWGNLLSEFVSVGSLFYDDFSTYATQGAADAVWVTTDTAIHRANITNDNLDFIIKRHGGGVNKAVTVDLGTALSNTAWRLRFKMVVNTITQPTSSNFVGYIGMFSADSSTGADAAQDFISLKVDIIISATDQYSLRDDDGVGPDNGGGESTFTTAPSVTTLYVDMRRTSSTAYTVSLYSDATFTTLVESQNGTVSATTTGLRYFGIKDQVNTNVNGTFTGTLDDIQVWNSI